MLVSIFYLYGLFRPVPHLPPTHPLTWCISNRAVNHLKKLSKQMVGNLLVIFMAPIEYTVAKFCVATYSG